MNNYETTKEEQELIEEKPQAFFKSMSEILTVHEDLQSNLSNAHYKIQVLTILSSFPILVGLSFYAINLLLNNIVISIFFSIIATLTTMIAIDSWWATLKRNKFIGKINNFYLSLFKKHTKLEEQYNSVDEKVFNLIQDPAFQKNLIVQLDTLINQTEDQNKKDSLSDDLYNIVYNLSYENYESVKASIFNYTENWYQHINSIETLKLDKIKKLNYLKDMQIPMPNETKSNTVTYNLKTML